MAADLPSASRSAWAVSMGSVRRGCPACGTCNAQTGGGGAERPQPKASPPAAGGSARPGGGSGGSAVDGSGNSRGGNAPAVASRVNDNA